MIHTTFSKNRQRGSALVLLAMMLPIVLIPLCGLAVDASMCYIVQHHRQ